jgi:hypothetical protein
VPRVTFLIFVAVFIVLACLVLPVAVLAFFAAAGERETGVEVRSEPPRPTVIT